MTFLSISGKRIFSVHGLEVADLRESPYKHYFNKWLTDAQKLTPWGIVAQTLECKELDTPTMSGSEILALFSTQADAKKALDKWLKQNTATFN
jgi:hypothetical protein